MKSIRYIAAVVSMCMLLSIASVALAAPGDTTVFSPRRTRQEAAEEPQFYAEQVVLVGDMFYAKGYESVYRWQQGMEKPEKVCDLPAGPEEYWESYDQATPEVQRQLGEQVTGLVAGDGKLWAYNVYSGKIGELGVQGVQWSEVQLDMADMYIDDGRSKYPRGLTYPSVSEGTFYALRDTYSQDNWQDTRVLMRWDLATGALTQTPLECAQMICGYKPGQLLTFGSIYDDKTQKYLSKLTVLDLASGKESPLPLEMPGENTYELGGLAYDAEADSIYYAYDKQVWRSEKGGAFEAVAYMAQGYINQDSVAWLLPGSLYAVAGDGLYVRNVDPQYKAARVLRIQGGWEDAAFYGFSAQNPDVPVLVNYNDVDGEEVASAITGGDKQTDIFVVKTTGGLGSLIEKGFAADLSASTILTEDIASMYPQIQTALSNADGKPMGFPTLIDFKGWTVDTALWEHFNMGPLPTTYHQFFDYMLRWQQEYAQDHPQIAFVDGSYDGRSFFEIVLFNYMLQYERPAEAVDLTAPALHEVLQKIEQLDLEKVDRESMTEADWEEYQQQRNRPAMFYMYGRAGMFFDPTRTNYMSSTLEDGVEAGAYAHLLPMVFEEGRESCFKAEMYAMIVNPASQNIDLALQYLEYASQHDEDAYRRYALHPDLNEPVEDETFEETVKSMREWRADVEERLKSATGNEQRDLQDSLAYVDQWFADEERNKWMLSADAIASYRAYAPYMNFAVDSEFYRAEPSPAMQTVWELLQRYDDGSLPLDALTKELNGKMRMIFLEGQ